jgi:hypothetical protein
MKRYLTSGAVVLALALGAFAGSHEGEFTWYKVKGPGPDYVNIVANVVSGHGKTRYVFSGARQGPMPRQSLPALV